MQSLDKNAAYRRSSELDSVAIDGETVMMDLIRGEYYGLNEAGSRIWQLFATPTTIDEMVDTLVKEYDANRSAIERDLELFLVQLLRKGLIVPDISHGPAPD